MVKIVLSNKVAYTFIAVGVLVLIAISVNAYNPSGTGGTPSIMGHSIDELEGVQARITNGLTECVAPNKAIKTIDPDTGVITCETDDAGGGISGGGAINYIPKFTGATSIGNSVIYQNSATSNIGIGPGTTDPLYQLDVASDARIKGNNFYISTGTTAKRIYVGSASPLSFEFMTSSGNAVAGKFGSLWISDAYAGTPPANGAYIKGDVAIGGVIKSSTNGNVIIQLG